MYNEQLINTVLAKTREILNTPKVEKIEDHFAGYFDELEITIWLSNDASDEEMKIFATSILDYLNIVLPKEKCEFKWILSFYRSLKQIGLFFPGDAVNDNSAAD